MITGVYSVYDVKYFYISKKDLNFVESLYKAVTYSQLRIN